MALGAWRRAGSGVKEPLVLYVMFTVSQST